ncbi:MAG: hypothetical protein ACI9KE_003505 [Polyangiales bacterium]|jgi:hypothetical protein
MHFTSSTESPCRAPRLRRVTQSLPFALVALAALGCSDSPSVETDASTLDSSVMDAAVDGNVADAGTSDASETDASETDANTALPGLVRIDDFIYAGAFRISSSMFGGSNLNYAVGTLGYNPEAGSLFIAGHAQHTMVAEFAIPDSLGMSDVVTELPVVASPLQDFVPVLEAVDNPDGLNRITGLYWKDGDLLVNANSWYDAPGTAEDTTLVIEGGDLDGTVRGFHQLRGRARAAGFMSPIPEDWQETLGGTELAGWASNYSIISRYSVGPTLFAFNAALPEAGGPIDAQIHLDYPFGERAYLSDNALEYQCTIDGDVTTCTGEGASDLWNHVSKAMYGFIVPGTRTYAIFGSNAGARSGLGYKIIQENDNLCGGPCSRDNTDSDNYYWFYDLDEILAAESPSDPRPYAYGPWEPPFGPRGSHKVIGGSFAADRGVLYLALGGAGQVGRYDRPPLILAFEVPVR